MNAAITALSMLTLISAPRTPYGGDLEAVAWGAAPIFNPAGAGSVADLFLAGAVFETLYRIDAKGDLQPVLAAGPPRFDGLTVTIPIRSGVRLHDGSELDANLVAASLRRLTEPRSRGAYVVLPIQGARQRLAGDAAAALAIEGSGTTLTLRLAGPYAGISRLLASPRASIAVQPSGDGRPWTGTGPFRMIREPTGALTLTPHLQHRAGRPFVDRVVFKVAATTFAARARFRRKEASMVFGLPDLGAQAERGARVADGAPGPLELIVLSIGKGRPALRSAAMHRSIDAAINRRRLSRRYIPGAARPATTLFGDTDGPRARVRAGERLRAQLLVAPERSPGLRFAERVQLDLLRAGVTAVIERVDGPTFDARRAAGNYELMLDAALIEPAPIDDATGRLHQLLAAAAWWGQPTSIVERGGFAAFDAAPEPGRRARADAMEREFRRRSGLIPIAARTQSVWMQRNLHGASLDSSGVLRIADAHFPAPAERSK